MSEMSNSSENVEKNIDNSKESITSQVDLDPSAAIDGSTAVKVDSTAVNIDQANGDAGQNTNEINELGDESVSETVTKEVVKNEIENVDELNGQGGPTAVNVNQTAVNVDPTAVNVDTNANGGPNEGNVNQTNNPSKPSFLSNVTNFLSNKNTNATANAPVNAPANAQANAQGKGMFSRLNPFTKAVAKTAAITGTARDGSLRINLYKVDNGFAAEVIPITGENIDTPKNLPLVADLSGKPIKLGIDAAVTNKQAGGKSRKRRTIRKNGGYNSARFFSITKKRVHRNKSANKKHYVNKTLRK